MRLPLPTYLPITGSVGASGLALTALLGLAVGLVVIRLTPGPPAPRANWAVLALGLLVGGRLANQIAAPDLIWHEPTTWLAITGYSLSLTGALVGASAALWLALPRTARPQWRATLDRLAPGASAAIAVGWVGVPVLGRVTTWPWGLPIGPGTAVQPVQLYGLVGFGLLAAWLGATASHRAYPGEGFIRLAVIGSLLHFLIGFAEQTNRVLGPWTWAQIGDAALAVAGLALAARWSRREPGAVPLGGRARALFGLLGASAVALSVFAAQGMHLPVFPGERAPAFTLSALQGPPVSLSSLRGHPVLLNFWATWCTACQAEAPALAVFAEQETGTVAVVGIDVGEPEATVAAYVRANALPWIFLLDPSGLVSGAYDVRYLPTSIVLDSTEVVRAVLRGEVTSAKLHAEFTPLLPASGG